MISMFIIAIIVAIVASLTTHLWDARKMQFRLDGLNATLMAAETRLSSSEAVGLARESELRCALTEARERENTAVLKSEQAAHLFVEANNNLKAALQEKGRLEAENARTDEIRAALLKRNEEIEALHSQVIVLNAAKTEALKDVEAANRITAALIEKEREAQQQIVRAKDEQIAKLGEFITHARSTLSTEFKALSADALRNVMEELVNKADFIIEKNEEKTCSEVQISKQHIQRLLMPIEETMKRLDRHVEENEVARVKAEALLDAQVHRLAEASESLSNALRKPVVRGSWGEMALENALESAGLQAEVDYVLQHVTDAEDGLRRTDAVVNLPKGRKLVIDSKNLMETYIAVANAEEETQRAHLAEVHSKSLRKHIKALSSKEYWRRYEGLDCVILFIPNDGMYHAAIQDEAELVREACDKRVFISNPMSLMPLLKAIRYVLDQERLNTSAEAISELGSDLYRELARFAEGIAKLGKHLKSTVNAYNDALPGLDRFIVAKSRALKQLGSAKGPEAELPPAIEIEPRFFASAELQLLSPPRAQAKA